MRKKDIDTITGIFLIISVILTASTGLIASRLELHRFVPHKYFAYSTLFLICLHLFFNLPGLFKYIKMRFFKT